MNFSHARFVSARTWHKLVMRRNEDYYATDGIHNEQT